jgi:hypothetical protein
MERVVGNFHILSDNSDTTYGRWPDSSMGPDTTLLTGSPPDDTVSRSLISQTSLDMALTMANSPRTSVDNHLEHYETAPDPASQVTSSDPFSHAYDPAVYDPAVYAHASTPSTEQCNIAEYSYNQQPAAGYAGSPVAQDVGNASGSTNFTTGCNQQPSDATAANISISNPGVVRHAHSASQTNLSRTARNLSNATVCSSQIMQRFVTVY